MNATGLAGPGRPVRSERPALRIDQTRFISRLVGADQGAQPKLARRKRREPPAHVVIEKFDEQNRLARLRRRVRAIFARLETAVVPSVCSKSGRSMCSIAAGLQVEQFDRRLHRFRRLKRRKSGRDPSLAAAERFAVRRKKSRPAFLRCPTRSRSGCRARAQSARARSRSIASTFPAASAPRSRRPARGPVARSFPARRRALVIRARSFRCGRRPARSPGLRT